METTYTIQGSDGKQYGPVTLAQLKEWVTDGRVDAQSRILRSDQSEWRPAGSFSEIELQANAANPAAIPCIITPAAPSPDLLALEARVKSGASWFYWIAGLSLINSIASLTGSGYGFVLGLGITQIIDVIGKNFGGAGTAIAVVVDLMAAGMLVAFGIFANKKRSWAFIAGMVLYALDGVVFLMVGDWLGVGFHVFALYCIFSGYKAMQQWRQITSSMPVA